MAQSLSFGDGVLQAADTVSFSEISLSRTFDKTDVFLQSGVHGQSPCPVPPKYHNPNLFS